MEKAVLKQNRDRIIQREIFSKKYATLSSVAGSNVATSYALLKMAFYDVKSQEELLKIKGLSVKPNGKRVKYSEYLDFVSADELRYLNKGLDCILDKIGKENSSFSGFPFIYNEIIELGKNLRYDFLEEVGVLPEQVAPELTSIKKVKKSATQTKIKPISSSKTVENERALQAQGVENAKVLSEQSKKSGVIVFNPTLDDFGKNSKTQSAGFTIKLTNDCEK